MPPVNGCLEFASGEARAEDGVEELVFRGIRLGDGCASLGSSGSLDEGIALALPAVVAAVAVAAAYVRLFIGFGISSPGVGPEGIGGACIMEILFSLLASVGLIVLAPSPDARPEAAIDCRRLPDEDGVCALWLPPFEESFDLLGVFGSEPPPSERGGGCKDLTLFCRDCVVACSVETREVESMVPEIAEVDEG
jgi:hypothetical protein